MPLKHWQASQHLFVTLICSKCTYRMCFCRNLKRIWSLGHDLFQALLGWKCFQAIVGVFKVYNVGWHDGRCTVGRWWTWGGERQWNPELRLKPMSKGKSDWDLSLFEGRTVVIWVKGLVNHYDSIFPTRQQMTGYYKRLQITVHLIPVSRVPAKFCQCLSSAVGKLQILGIH